MRGLFQKPPAKQTETQLEESIRREVEVSQTGVLEYGMPLDMDAFYMSQIKKIWAFMKDRYGTRYKMTTDVLDWDELADRIAGLPCCGGEVSRHGRAFSAKLFNRTWHLSWRGDGRFQIISISPFGQLMPGMRTLCATYRIPEMIADTDFWIGRLDKIIREETMKIRQKIAQRRINTSTARALLEGELGGKFEYKTKFRDDQVSVSVVLHNDRMVELTFQYEEMYVKVPLLGKAVRDINSLIDSFGPKVDIGYAENGINALFKRR